MADAIELPIAGDARANIGTASPARTRLLDDALMAHTPVGRPDTLSNVVSDGVQATIHSAFQSPITGGAQIVDRVFNTHWEQSSRFMDAPQQAEFGSWRWHSQQVGSAAGMILPFVLVARGNRAAFGRFQVARAGSALAAEGNSFFTASRGLAVAEQATNGFIFDAVLRPSDSSSPDFWLDRGKHGAVGALTFGTLTASSLGLRHVMGIPAHATGLRNFLARDVATGVISGLPAGYVSAHGSALADRGRFANSEEVQQGMYTMAMIGGSLSALHVIPGERGSLAERVANGEHRGERGRTTTTGRGALSERLTAKETAVEAGVPRDGTSGAASVLASMTRPGEGRTSRLAAGDVTLNVGFDPAFDPLGTTTREAGGTRRSLLENPVRTEGERTGPTGAGEGDPASPARTEAGPAPNGRTGPAPDGRTPTGEAGRTDGRTEPARREGGTESGGEPRTETGRTEGRTEGEGRGEGTPTGEQVIRIGTDAVRVEHVRDVSEGVREVRLLEDYGANPAGTRMTMYDKTKYPDGVWTEHGGVSVIAEHPDGTRVFTRSTGNGVWIFPEPRLLEYEGGRFEARQVEQLPDGTELWTTVDGGRVEWYPDGRLPQTAFGEVFRVDSVGNVRRYYTTDGLVFDLVQGGPQLRVLKYEGESNVIQEELHVDSFKEVFPENMNLTRWGPVTDRTITSDGIQMTLLDGNTAFSYPTERQLADNRVVLDGIRYKDGTINFILQDGTIFGQRSSQHLLPFDWRGWEYNRPDGATVYHYLDGERVEFRNDGTSIETYPNEISTTLGNFVEVVRGPNSNVYWARDGSRVEVPLRGGAPVVRYGIDGRANILDVQTVREIFPNGREREFGVIKSVEYNTDGTTIYHLDTAYAADLQSVTLLGRQRFGIDGYALKTPPRDRPTAEPRYLLIRGDRITGPELTADQLETLLNTGRLSQ